VQLIAAGVIGGATGLFWEGHPLVVALIWAVVLLVAAVTGHRPVVGWPRALVGLGAALAVLWLWHEYVGPMVD
jgi:uncharacterized membrane protein